MGEHKTTKRERALRVFREEALKEGWMHEKTKNLSHLCPHELLPEWCEKCLAERPGTQDFIELERLVHDGKIGWRSAMMRMYARGAAEALRAALQKEG